MDEISSAEKRAIFAATSTDLITTSAEGAILTISPDLAALLGRHLEDFSGRNLVDFLCEPLAVFGIVRPLEWQDIVDAEELSTVFLSRDTSRIRAELAVHRYQYNGDCRCAVFVSNVDEQHATVVAEPSDESTNRLIIDHAVIGIALTDTAGNWIRVNQAYCDMLGYSESEIRSLDFTRITHPDDLATDLQKLSRLHQGEVSDYVHEKRYIRKDGSTFWVRVHVAGVYDENGNLTHHSTQIIDVDAEHVALSEKNLLQQQMQAFMDNVPANITMTDGDGNYSLVNRRLAKSVNLDPQSVIGRSFGSIEGSTEDLALLKADSRRIMASAETIEREISAPWDPDIVLQATRFPIFGPQNEVAGVGSISTDITKLKSVERGLIAQTHAVELFKHIAVAVNESGSTVSGAETSLALICREYDWPLGCISLYRDGQLEEPAIWYYATDGDAEICREGFAVLDLGPESVRYRALTTDEPQVETLKQHYVSRMAFRLADDREIFGVLECYSLDAISNDQALFDLMTFVNAQIGHAIKRETAETAARTALDQLSYHINNAAVGIVELDRELRVAVWSPQCEKIFGWRADEVLGKHYNDVSFVHPEDQHLLAAVNAKLDDAEFKSYNVFHRNITKSGNIVHVDWYNSIRRDEAGAPQSILAVAVDRSGEVEAQTALRDERNLFMNGPTMVFRWVFDPIWTIQYASPNVEAILGHHPCDIVSGSIPLSRWVHGDDLAALQSSLVAFKRSDEKQWVLGPFRMVSANGGHVWAKGYATRLSDVDGKDQFAAYVLDITQMRDLQDHARLQEHRLLNVIDGTNAGTWEWNVVTGETIFNARWAEIIGYTLDELSPVSINTWAELAHPDDLLRSNHSLQDHFDGTVDHYDFEGRMRHKDGHWVWVHDRGKVVERTDTGEPLWVAGTHMDITKRKADEQRLIEINEALAESNIELEQFAYVASHDLQEPLRMVASFTQLLERAYADQLDDQAREYIHYAVDGASRMQELIRDLLSYSRAGRHQIDDTRVHLGSVVNRVAELLKLSHSNVEINLSVGVLPIIQADLGQIHQVLQNLVGNAIKYRRGSKVMINISWQRHGEEAVFSVADDGIGIEGQYEERIFEIFQRLHARTQYPGTGIGLSICRRIIERHGGKIWVESVPGEGSTFQFSLPGARILVEEPDMDNPPDLNDRSVA